MLEYMAKCPVPLCIYNKTINIIFDVVNQVYRVIYLWLLLIGYTFHVDLLFIGQD